MNFTRACPFVHGHAVTPLVIYYRKMWRRVQPEGVATLGEEDKII